MKWNSALKKQQKTMLAKDFFSLFIPVVIIYILVLLYIRNNEVAILVKVLLNCVMLWSSVCRKIPGNISSDRYGVCLQVIQPFVLNFRNRVHLKTSFELWALKVCHPWLFIDVCIRMHYLDIVTYIDMNKIYKITSIPLRWATARYWIQWKLFCPDPKPKCWFPRTTRI